MRAPQVRSLGREDPLEEGLATAPVVLPDYAKGLDSVDHNKLWKILKEMGI